MRLPRKKGGVRTSERRLRNPGWSILEGEIHPGARHAEVVLRTVNKVPAEITYPADVRREPDFDAAADLANSLRLTPRVTLCLDDIEAFPLFKNSYVVWPLATAKDGPAAPKNVGRKPRTGDRVTQGQSA